MKINEIDENVMNSVKIDGKAMKIDEQAMKINEKAI